MKCDITELNRKAHGKRVKNTVTIEDDQQGVTQQEAQRMKEENRYRNQMTSPVKLMIDRILGPIEFLCERFDAFI